MECFMSIWEDIFYEYGVDMVFNGHVHAYERTHPMYKYQPDTCGPIYVTIGDGGNVEGPYRNYVDESVPATNKTYCEFLSYGGVGPLAMAASAPSSWGPIYQRMVQPPGCPTLSFQPASGVAGGPPLLILPNSTTAASAAGTAASAAAAAAGEPLGFCQSSQPAWSAFRDPSFGHAVLELQSDTVARFQWFKNVAQDDVVLERLGSCPNRVAGAAGGRRARRMAAGARA
ncbi:hypothetical protein GPECTOR_100g13 [Gonium pectorale]|uniref:Purple acid phosphatase C-terminal domain-containing protein n=1 Tax=Gonium pectorale TaxID=33097 RepID=A0A150FZZ1_GONPE|nr:hypothetical protein GPECTOR_100g13 [Gonium pectorale]|eukprot:KXZ43141.1 hypothetical protein GPECTOR_100g13 [Gonium pectorale]